jgi:hypothetical protein
MSIINTQHQRNLFGDLSLWSLLLSNLATIFSAIKENWNLLTIMWVYWFQSITIGFFNFIRILQLKKFSTKGVEIGNQPAKPTRGTKISIAFFFLFHYGLFHVAYMMFLSFYIIGMLSPKFDRMYIDALLNAQNLNELKYIHDLNFNEWRYINAPTINEPNFIEWRYIYLTSLLFFINHLFSYIYNRPKDTKKQNIGSLMVYPYIRIIPMHLTIIFGPVFPNAALPFFLMLKTFADCTMHIVEHNVLRKG